MCKPDSQHMWPCSSDVWPFDCYSSNVYHMRTSATLYFLKLQAPVWGRGTPLPPCPFTGSSFPPFYFSFSFIGFIYFLLLPIPSLFTRIVPLRFQAGGRRRRPNLGLVCVLLCNLCYLYSLDVVFCSVWFSLVLCVFLQCFDTVGWVIWPVKTRPWYDL